MYGPGQYDNREGAVAIGVSGCLGWGGGGGSNFAEGWVIESGRDKGRGERGGWADVGGPDRPRSSCRRCSGVSRGRSAATKGPRNGAGWLLARRTRDVCPTRTFARSGCGSATCGCKRPRRACRCESSAGQGGSNFEYLRECKRVFISPSHPGRGDPAALHTSQGHPPTLLQSRLRCNRVLLWC